MSTMRVTHSTGGRSSVGGAPSPGRGGRFTGGSPVGHNSPPPLSAAQMQQAGFAQQAYVALGQDIATDRPQWREGARQAPSPMQTRNTARITSGSSHSLQAPPGSACGYSPPPKNARHMHQSPGSHHQQQQQHIPVMVQSGGSCTAPSSTPAKHPAGGHPQVGSLPLPLGNHADQPVIAASPAGKPQSQAGSLSIAPPVSKSSDEPTARLTPPIGWTDARWERPRQVSTGGCSVSSVPASSPGTNLRETRVPVEVVSTSRPSTGDGVNLAIQKLAEDLKTAQEEGNKKIIDDIEERLYSAEKAKDEKRNKELENKNAELESQSKDLEKKIAEAGSRNKELESKLCEVEIKNKELEHRLMEMEAQKEKYLQKSDQDKDNLKRRQNEDLSKAQAQNQQLKTEVAKKTQEIEDIRQAADRAKTIKEKEMAKSESMLAEAKQNNDELKTKNKQLELKLKQLDQQERKSSTFEQQLAEIKAERNELQKKICEQGHEIQQIPHLQHELAAREQALEEKDRLLEVQRKEQEEAAARQVLEPRDRYRKHSCNEKENINRSRTVQELKDEIERLEFQIREEQQVSTLSPGELIKMSKKVESEVPWADICEEQKKNVSLQIELEETKWHVEILKRYMPIALHETVQRDIEKGRLLHNRDST